LTKIQTDGGLRKGRDYVLLLDSWILARNCFFSGVRRPDIQKFIVLLIHVVGPTPPPDLRHSTPFANSVIARFS